VHSLVLIHEVFQVTPHVTHATYGCIASAPTRSQASRAARRRRIFELADVVGGEDLDEMIEDVETLASWRSAHESPLMTATTGLRSRLKTSGCSNVTVTQRWKREMTVRDKLLH
jgi:hypothetical protein